MKKITAILILLSQFSSFSGAKETEPLTMTYGSDYKPFAWGENGKALGVQKAFVEEILNKRMGIHVVHQSFPWKRCQEYVKLGIKDGFFTVPTPERTEYTLKTDTAFYKTHFVMHTGINNPNIKRLRTVKTLQDLEAMTDLKHVHMLGSGWHENALKNMKNVYTILDASNIPVMLNALRTDVYIEQAEMFRYQAKVLGLSDNVLTFNEPVIKKMEWHIFIGKESKFGYLIPEINEILASLEKSGELEEIKNAIFKKYDIHSSRPENTQDSTH